MIECINCKLLLIGDKSVGKSALLDRYEGNTFDESIAPTSSVSFKNTTVTIDGVEVKLQIWDKVDSTYYRIATGFIFIYDISSIASFKSIESWCSGVEEHCTNFRHLPRFLIGTKSDTEHRAVTREDAQDLAETTDMIFWEVSAKTGAGVVDTFSQIAKILKEKQDD